MYDVAASSTCRAVLQFGQVIAAMVSSSPAESSDSAPRQSARSPIPTVEGRRADASVVEQPGHGFQGTPAPPLPELLEPVRARQAGGYSDTRRIWPRLTTMRTGG